MSEFENTEVKPPFCLRLECPGDENYRRPVGDFGATAHNPTSYYLCGQGTVDWPILSLPAILSTDPVDAQIYDTFEEAQSGAKQFAASPEGVARLRFVDRTGAPGVLEWLWRDGALVDGSKQDIVIHSMKFTHGESSDLSAPTLKTEQGQLKRFEKDRTAGGQIPKGYDCIDGGQINGRILGDRMGCVEVVVDEKRGWEVCWVNMDEYDALERMLTGKLEVVKLNDMVKEYVVGHVLDEEKGDAVWLTTWKNHAGNKFFSLTRDFSKAWKKTFNYGGSWPQWFDTLPHACVCESVEGQNKPDVFMAKDGDISPNSRVMILTSDGKLYEGEIFGVKQSLNEPFKVTVDFSKPRYKDKDASMGIREFAIPVDFVAGLQVKPCDRAPGTGGLNYEVFDVNSVERMMSQSVSHQQVVPAVQTQPESQGMGF